MSDSGAPAPSATVEGKPKMDIEEDDDDDEQAPAEQKGKTVGFKEEEEEEEEELDESDALLEHRVAIAIRPDEEAWKDATVGKTDVAVQQMYESALRSAHDALKASRDLDRVLEKEREEADASLREKEHAEAELKASLLQLVADTAKRATDSKGKPLPKGALADFEQRTAELEAALEEERTKNVKLRAAMRAIDQSMKRKEALRDGLHLIDFEQLKIENQAFAEKIEDRNEEIGKLRRKIDSTIQVLTHVKEKLVFVRDETEKQLQAQLTDIEAKVLVVRDGLGSSKQERDTLRSVNVRLQQQNGLVGATDLLRDYEANKAALEEAKERLEHLRRTYANLTQGQSVPGTTASSVRFPAIVVTSTGAAPTQSPGHPPQS